MKIEPTDSAVRALASEWIHLMPVLIAAIENGGTGDGNAIAKRELATLAAAVDSANARASERAAGLAQHFCKFAEQNESDAGNARTHGGRAVAMARASAFYIAARDVNPWVAAGFTERASACYESALESRSEADAAALSIARAMADAAALHVDSANGSPANKARAYGAAVALYRHAARVGGSRFAHCEGMAESAQELATAAVKLSVGELAAMTAARNNAVAIVNKTAAELATRRAHVESIAAALDAATFDSDLFARDVANLAAHGFRFGSRAVFDATHAAAKRPGIAGTAGAWAIYDAESMGDSEAFALVGDSPSELARDAADSVLS